jgi:chromosomal replication initiator protein
LDDVDLISFKTRTAEELAGVLSALCDRGSLTVMVSGRPLDEMHCSDERLQAILGDGFCAKLTPPRLETWLSILSGAAEREGIHLPPDVGECLVRRLPPNGRLLLLVLTRLAALATLRRVALSVGFAEEVLNDWLE